MDVILPSLTGFTFVLVLGIAVFAGVVKGVVGFAMPTIFISGLSTFLSPEIALAGLIMPTLVTNAMQALRQGRRAAWDAIRRFRVFLLVGGAVLMGSAQLVRMMPEQVLYLAIGVSVTVFSVLQIFGWRPTASGKSRFLEVSVGAFAGFIGGLSGIWGPPTVAYLTAIGTQKAEQMRVQGVVYGTGAALLSVAHLQSGVLRAETIPFSLMLVLPAVAGIWLGFRIQDRIDQQGFRKLTLCVLIIAGLNLIRRGLIG